MHLNQWIKQQGYGAKGKLARECGCGWNVINYLCQRKRFPTYHLALRIVEVTGGAVTVDEIFAPLPRKPVEAKSARRPRRKAGTPRRKRVAVEGAAA